MSQRPNAYLYESRHPQAMPRDYAHRPNLFHVSITTSARSSSLRYFTYANGATIPDALASALMLRCQYLAKRDLSRPYSRLELKMKRYVKRAALAWLNRADIYYFPPGAPFDAAGYDQAILIQSPYKKDNKTPLAK